MSNRNWPFLIWMLVFPLACSAGDYLDFLANGSVVKHYTDDTRGLAALILMTMWLTVGAMLYERRREGTH